MNMRILKYLIIIPFAVISMAMFSQNSEKPSKISFNDFNNSSHQSPTILYYKSLVTFPYREDYGQAGALDKFFGLNLRTFIRIAFNKKDSCQKIIAFPHIYDKVPQMNSIKYYYRKNNSIATRKIKESDLIISSDVFAYYIDFSKIIMDSLVIFDVDFYTSSYEPYYKQKLLFYLDKNILYKKFIVQLYIPEIYFYEKAIPDPCFSLNIKTNILGPRIGYKSVSGSSDIITSKVLVDMFTEKFHSKFEQVYCKLNLLSFKFNNTCDGLLNSSCKEIINYKLKNIVERK
jgi:hypothetical protein